MWKYVSTILFSEDHAMLSPSASAVCGSDLHFWQHAIEAPLAPTATTPHPLTGETLPVITGHEYVFWN